MSKTVGEYVLKEKIGKGSYADVYKGTHKVTGQKYAIKAISKDILSEPKLLAGLESEIKIMREFAHENIVCLHEYFSSEKNFYLVLELCEGGDLSKFIKKKKRLDERLAHSFLAQITSGLAFLHEKNFIHRDLKPANVLLSEFSDNAVLKLADFGFARQLTVASLAQTRCGTPLYMAPEILESKDYDGKADIWSVGCIFYEMLVGTSPFKGTNEADLLMNIKTKELNVPKEVVLSKVSIEILIKLLERHPIRRAALPQLVALCAHLGSLPPGPAPVFGGGEEMGLPVPPPADMKTPEMSRSRPVGTSTPGTADTPEGVSRRRLGSAAEGSDGVEGAFPAQRRYAGGPAPSNLQGMFGSPQGADTASPTHASMHNVKGSPYVASGAETASRRHSLGAHATQMDPQFSKTLRAPYAGNPVGQKYPSPSSSPPTTGMMGMGGFLQSASAPVHASQVAPSTSPAAATIGMVGNLIAYVFNPSPSPSAGADRSHSQPGLRNYTQHGRSFSADRTAPPNFTTGNNGGGYFGNGGAGTPPPSSKARGTTDRRVREDHFAYPEGMEAGPLPARSPHPNPNSSTASMEDGDFVMINNSASEGERRAGRGDATAPQRPSMPPSHSASESSSSGSRSAGNPSGGNSYAVNSAIPVEYRSYDMEQDARANETAAVHAFYASTVQRCQVYSAVVASITTLGDQYAREGLEPLQNASMSSASDDDDSIAGFVQAPPKDVLPRRLKQVTVERYLVACSLYLHALSILGRLMKSFESSVVQELPENLKATLHTLKTNLSTAFEQLIGRAESCQKHIDAVINPENEGKAQGGAQAKYVMPQPGPIMVDAAKRREMEAEVQEQLGNLALASKLLLSANELVQGVALTASDPEYQRLLQVYSHTLTEKYNACCQQRAVQLQVCS